MTRKIESKNEIINKWVKFDPVRNQYNPAFTKIVDFYLFNSPVRGINYYSAKTITEYGWEKNKLSTLKKLLLMNNDLRTNFFQCSSCDDLELTILNNHVYGDQVVHKEIVLFLNNKKSIVESVLYLLRCAFAHRSFCIVRHKSERYYFVANVDNGRIKGRLVLKESTLLKWIDIIKG